MPYRLHYELRDCHERPSKVKRSEASRYLRSRPSAFDLVFVVASACLFCRFGLFLLSLPSCFYCRFTLVLFASLLVGVVEFVFLLPLLAAAFLLVLMLILFLLLHSGSSCCSFFSSKSSSSCFFPFPSYCPFCRSSYCSSCYPECK